MVDVADQLNSLVLSASDVKELTGWPDPLIEEWLNIIRNSILIATGTDENSQGIAGKADKISPATEDNLVSQDAGGNIKDSAIASSAITDNAQGVSDNAAAITSLQIVVINKVDKVGGATADNIASFVAGGNIQDTGFKISDLVMIVGTGNPNGSVISNQSRQFFDTAGSTLYANPNAGVNTGWVAV